MSNMIFPFFKAWRANGTTPANGYYLYTYEAGTTTPKATYSDVGLTTPNANPVVLNSIGEATIFLSSGGYKFELKTPAGATVWTFDNISGGADGSLIVVENIAALKSLSPGDLYQTVIVLSHTTVGDGGGGVFYFDSTSSASDNNGTVLIPNSSPGLGRWKRIIDSAWSYSWFGAVGDGTTDDTTAITNCITALIAAGGGALEVNRLHRISSTVTHTSAIRVIRKFGGWTASSSTSLVFNGVFECGIEQAFFGSVVVTGTPALEKFYPEWWGSNGFEKAVTMAALSSKAIVRLNSNQTLSGNLTIPSTVLIEHVSGIISGAYTLTIQGILQANRVQVFSSNVSVTTSTSKMDLVFPEWWGAVADGVTDDGVAINSSISFVYARGGGIVLCDSGKVYAVSGTNRVRLRSKVTLNLNQCTILRITDSAVLQNIIENYTYDGTGADTDIAVINGKVKGTGANTSTQTITLAASGFTAFVAGDIGKTFTDLQADPQDGVITAYDNVARTVTITGAQNLTGACNTTTGTGAGTWQSSTNVLSNTIPAGNIYFYGVNRFKLENLIFETSNGDNFGWRRSHNGIARNIIGGAFGRNGCSPTSGLNNRFENIDMTTNGFTGANPGEYFDVENDSSTEVSSTYWVNVKSKGITFVDFYTSAGDDFGHQAVFDNCIFTGNSPQTFRVLASNQTVAKNFIIGASCRIGIEVNTASSLVLSNVDSVRCYAKLANDDPAGQGSSSAIRLNGPVNDFIFGGSNAVDGFSTGLNATSYPITNSRFVGAHIGDIQLREGSDGNKFVGCTIGALTIIDSDSNLFKDCDINGTTTFTRSASNVFDSSTLVNLVFNEATCLNNRFAVSTRITGTKTFNSSSTWLGQYFEREEGDITPTITGSSNGNSVTHSVQWGRYNILGDILHFSIALTWTADGGATGNQRINLNLPNSIVPAGASDPSRHAPIIRGNGFAFTGSQLVGDISGGGTFITPYGLDNAGTLTNVPANTAAGTYYIQGFFRIR